MRQILNARITTHNAKVSRSQSWQIVETAGMFGHALTCSTSRRRDTLSFSEIIYCLRAIILGVIKSQATFDMLTVSGASGPNCMSFRISPILSTFEKAMSIMLTACQRQSTPPSAFAAQHFFHICRTRRGRDPHLLMITRQSADNVLESQLSRVPSVQRWPLTRPFHRSTERALFRLSDDPASACESDLLEEPLSVLGTHW